MLTEWRYFYLEVNPEPWAIGDLSVGRRNGKMFPMVGRNNTLWYYQQAIKEELEGVDLWIEGPITLQFFFWRRRDEYKTPQARGHRRHEADLTNLQKATEDALQGVLFKNDKDVKKVESTLIAQGPDIEPRVIVGVRNYTEVDNRLPDDVIELIGTRL